MENDFDVIIFGTGYKECLISGLLSSKEKKVLQLDSNSYYGTDNATLTIQNIYQKYKKLEKIPENKEKLLGELREYNIDICPKFILAAGNLIDILIKTSVNRYMDFRQVEGAFVYINDSLEKVPSTATEALGSSLIGFFQKRRLKNFFQFCNSFDENNIIEKEKIKLLTPIEFMKEQGLDSNSQAMIIHVVALYTDDSLVNDRSETINFIKRIKNYQEAMLRAEYSPFLYPDYGLSTLPEGFSRYSAIHGGTFMLRKNIDKIIFNNNNKVEAIQSGNDIFKCKILILHPLYALKLIPEYIEENGEIGKYLLIFNQHPFIHKKLRTGSFQLIFPGIQFNRKTDIYIIYLSNKNKVVPKDRYLLLVSFKIENITTKEQLQQVIDKQILSLLLEDESKLENKLIDKFFFINKIYKAKEVNNKKLSEDRNIYITNTADQSSHFEEATEEILFLYNKITGEKYKE